jgi:hypothetical protein
MHLQVSISKMSCAHSLSIHCLVHQIRTGRNRKTTHTIKCIAKVAQIALSFSRASIFPWFSNCPNYHPKRPISGRFFVVLCACPSPTRTSEVVSQPITHAFEMSKPKPGLRPLPSLTVLTKSLSLCSPFVSVRAFASQTRETCFSSPQRPKQAHPVANYNTMHGGPRHDLPAGCELRNGRLARKKKPPV